MFRPVQKDSFSARVIRGTWFNAVLTLTASGCERCHSRFDLDVGALGAGRSRRSLRLERGAWFGPANR